MPVQTTTHEGQLSPDQEKTYVHLPFEVPAGAVRIEVGYEYDQRISAEPAVTGGNTIDLGVFDARGIDFLKAGFRGWSGSERDTFFITASQATPGYLPGALSAGTWHVMLGLYKISPRGCRYRVSVRVITQAGQPAGGALPAQVEDLPASAPAGVYAPWLRGQLHCHSQHSDGTLSVSQLVGAACECGLDFLAVTDHNTTASQGEQAQLRDPGLILIRGMEVTTFKGHFNAWGIPDWVDFRVTCEEDLRNALACANERGALTSCNHPKPGGPPWDYPAVDQFHCMEVWNGPWEKGNQVSLETWLALLAGGRRIPAVAGSDFHKYAVKGYVVERTPGAPCTWVYAPGAASTAGILQAIRAGHTCLSQDSNGPLLDLRVAKPYCALAGDVIPRPGGDLEVELRCMNGVEGELRLLDQRGARHTRTLGRGESTVTLNVDTRESLYLRAELRASDGRMLAMTNPLYFDKTAQIPVK